MSEAEEMLMQEITEDFIRRAVLYGCEEVHVYYTKGDDD